MHRIDTPDATPDHRFTEGDPTIPLPATMVSADWLNAVQEELSGVIEGAGLTLDKVRHDQLKAAITKMITDRAAPLATTEQAGLVERATDAEAQAGTDGERYVTPKQLKDAVGTTDLTAMMRDTFAGCIVEWECETIPNLNDGKPLGIELNGAIVSLTAWPRLLRKWCGAAKNATAPAWYRCNASGVRDAAGDHIRLQDRRGEFTRGWDHGRGVDVGRVLGSWQGDEMKSHNHGWTGTEGGGYPDSPSSRTTPGTARSYVCNTRITDVGGSETRGRNIATMYLVLV